MSAVRVAVPGSVNAGTQKCSRAELRGLRLKDIHLLAVSAKRDDITPRSCREDLCQFCVETPESSPKHVLEHTSYAQSGDHACLDREQKIVTAKSSWLAS